MGALTGINVLLFIVLLAFLGVYLYKMYRSMQLAGVGALIPFGGMQGTKLNRFDSDGQVVGPQIACPVGTTVNIVGAYYEVKDQYGQCTTSPDKNIIDMCKSTPENPICKNLDSSGKNLNCQDCKIRDASAHLSAKCNGKEECDVTVNSTFFGIPPCGGVTVGDGRYKTFPQLPGDNAPIQGYYAHGIFTCEKK